jgi:tyrosyl-tRNA synthetase
MANVLTETKSVFDSSSTLTLPISKKEYDQRVQELSQELKSKSTAFVSKNYLGHMNFELSAPHLDGLKAALPYNPNQVAFESSPQTSLYEQRFIQSMCRMIGYPATAWGYVTTGGTISNLEGLWLARENAKTKGKIVLGTIHTHYCVKKVCDILGLVYVELSDWPTTDSEWDRALTGAIAVVATLGTTELGMVDPLDKILTACNRHKVWVHADAAYGGYFIRATNPETHEKFKLMKLCDSVSIDPHKMGFAPYGVGTFLLRDGHLRSSIHSTEGVSYIDSKISSSTTVEGSRNGSLVTSAYFGHEQLSPIYPKIMDGILRGAEMLRTALRADPTIIVHPTTDLGIVLFRFTGSEPPMRYFVRRFTPNENAISLGRLTLVTTIPRGEHNPDNNIYFRACVCDPDFPLYCNKFVEQLQRERREYAENYEDWVQIQLDILTSFTVEQDLPALTEMIRSCDDYTCYNGFEPSNRSMTFAQGLTTVINTLMMLKAGCKHMTLYIADRFAQLNLKYGGDLARIQDAGRFYIELFNILGLSEAVSRGSVGYVWASDILKNPAYWERVMDMSCGVTLNRIKKCTQIMGRENAEELQASQILYPIMQACDVFELDVDCTEMGLDQRKVNMLVIEQADKFRPGKRKPVILSHKMLSSLKGKAKGGKMSKSDPRGAIFIDDTPQAVVDKVMGAFCPDTIEDNPIFDYLEAILFRWASLNNSLPLRLCGQEFYTISASSSCQSRQCSYCLTPEVFAGMDKKQLKIDVAELVNRILAPVQRAINDPFSPVYELYRILAPAPVSAPVSTPAS